jgi:hypothetical protein
MLILIAALIAGPPPTDGPHRISHRVSVATDSTPVLFARARAEARQARGTPAIAAYLAGARVAASPSDWALYRRDIFWIASPGELQAFDAAEPADRVALLESFWSSRDARDRLPTGGRFVEHVRRVDVAMAEYRVHPKRGKAPVSRASVSGGTTNFDYTVGRNSMLRDYAPGQGVIDDRGVILIRHGEPTARAAANVGVESWVYEREDRDNLVVHFSENVFDGSSGNTRLIAAPPISALESLCGLDAASCTVAQRFGGASTERRERLRQRALAAIRELTTTESAAVRGE